MKRLPPENQAQALIWLLTKALFMGIRYGFKKSYRRFPAGLQARATRLKLGLPASRISMQAMQTAASYNILRIKSSMDQIDRWAYPAKDKRDLRLDFMRGLIMVYVLVVHIECYSLFSLFAWERLGIISSAEGFVFLSGLVAGLVYGKRAATEGIKAVVQKLWRRSFQLYRVNVFVILSIAAFSLIPLVNVFELTHWWVPGHPDQSFALYPAASTSWWEIFLQAVMLKIGPHQFQIIGLYVVLLAVAPAAIYALTRGYTRQLLLFSWILYGLNAFLSLRLTVSRFELGFPLLTWQMLFYTGMVIGYHRERVLGYLVENRWIFILAASLSIGFILLGYNNPGTMFWPWRTWSFINPDTYANMYLVWFNKTTLGLGRLLNNAALFVTIYVLLSRYWHLFNRAVGWLVIPLGQASLYVFTLHVYAILLINNTPIPAQQSFLLNTLVHAATVLTIWTMVRRKFLFGWIPR
jgi:hypothetical protein